MYRRGYGRDRVPYGALELFEILTLKGKGIEAALEAVNVALDDSEIFVSRQALNLLRLIEKKYNITSLRIYLRKFKEVALKLLWNR